MKPNEHDDDTGIEFQFTTTFNAGDICLTDIERIKKESDTVFDIELQDLRRPRLFSEKPTEE